MLALRLQQRCVHMKKLLLSSVFISMIGGGLFVGTSSVLAQEGRKGPARIFYNLDLSDTQKQDISQIMRDTKENNRVYKGEMEALKQELDLLLALPEWDAQRAELIVRARINSSQQLQLNMAEAKHSAFQILNEDQQQEFISRTSSRWEGEKTKRSEKRLLRMQKRLGLSEEQIAEAEAIIEQQRDSLEAYKSEAKAHRASERALITTEDFDAEAYTELNEAIAESRVAAGLIKLKARYDLAQLLTDEQRAKAEADREKMKERLRNKRS